MKIIQQVDYGVADQCVRCVTVEDPPPPTGGDILIDIDAFPINPADILTLNGTYATRPPLPATPGAEGIGRVIAVGPEVSDLSVGDTVMPLSRGNWMQRKCVSQAEVIKVPAGDPLQLAMLKVNPATAFLMLTTFITLQSGNFVIQNAANSGVGRAVIALAQKLGFKTVNVVRRQELVADLTESGAEFVFVDGPSLAERVRAEVGEAPVRLAIDAVAGSSCLRLANCLSDGGTVVNYGLLSGEPCMIDPQDTVFRGIALGGFWLAPHLQAAPREDLESLYAELAALVLDGALATPVEATYPIEDIQSAVAHAARSGRNGKVLVTPNRG